MSTFTVTNNRPRTRKIPAIPKPMISSAIKKSGTFSLNLSKKFIGIHPFYNILISIRIIDCSCYLYSCTKQLQYLSLQANLSSSFDTLRKECQNQSTCDNGSNLTSYVCANCIHEYEVLRVFFLSHFLNNPRRHWEG